MKWLVLIITMLTFIPLCTFTFAGNNKVVVVPLFKLGCPAGQTDCNGKCVETAYNTNYCGNCTTTCLADYFCDSGKCVNRCDDNNDCTNDIYDPILGCTYTTNPGCQTTCNPVSGTGCPVGDKCTFVVDTGATSCTPNGDKLVGESCTTPISGADDCVAGAYCLNNICYEICGTSPNTCGGGDDCRTYTEFFTEFTDVGICKPYCNPVTQDCIDTSEACYLQPVSAEATCAAVTAGSIGKLQDSPCYSPPGSSCFINGCDKGYGANQPDNTCAFFCNPIDNWLGNIQGLAGDPAGITCGATFTGRPDGPGAGYECRYIQSYYANTQSVPATIGMCMSASTYGSCAIFDWVQLQADMTSGISNSPTYCNDYPDRCMTECISLATFNAATNPVGGSPNIDLYKSFSSSQSAKKTLLEKSTNNMIIW